MRKVADRDFVLLLDVGQERPLIIDAEGENAVLVWRGETDSENCAVLSILLWQKIQTMPGGKHGKFKLDCVVCRDPVRNPFIEIIFGNFNVKSLAIMISFNDRYFPDFD